MPRSEGKDPFADLEDYSTGSPISKTAACPAEQAADERLKTKWSLYQLDNTNQQVLSIRMQTEEYGCMSQHPQADPEMPSKDGSSNMRGLRLASPACLSDPALNHLHRSRRLRPCRDAMLVDGMSHEGKLKKVAGSVPELAEQDPLLRVKQTGRKKPSVEKPSSKKAGGSKENEFIQAPSQHSIQKRINRTWALPYGMLMNESPPVPQAVDDPEEVTEQEDLVESIYSREVSDEHLRRCAKATGMTWSSGVIPEFFLDKVLGEDQHRTDTLRDRVVDQIDQWLSLSPQKKRQWMNGLLETVVLDDMSHPACRRFKEYYEPLELRTEERAQRYRKDLPEWTLLGEYAGVWDRHDRVTQRINEDPMGLGVMRCDKVTALAYTAADASQDAQTALRAGWNMTLEIDSTRAHNRLCLINDCTDVPGYDNQPNVIFLECEDSRTLQPHLFHFTACSVKGGQEALLEYGQEYHKSMNDDLRRAAVIVAERRQRQEAEALLAEALHGHQEREQDLQGQVLAAQESLGAEQQGQARLKSELDEARARIRDLEQRLAQLADTMKREDDKTAPGVPSTDALLQQRDPSGLATGKLGPLEAPAQQDTLCSCLQGTVAELEKQLQYRRTTCNRMQQERDKYRKATQALKLKLDTREKELQAKEMVVQAAGGAAQQAQDEVEALKAEVKEKELSNARIMVLWQDTHDKSEAEIARLNKLHAEKDRALAEKDQRQLTAQQRLAGVQLLLPMPVAELLELARNVPLTVVPIRPIQRKQPEDEARLPMLPDLPAPAPLKSALEPGRADAEPAPADADHHPGTPDAQVPKERPLLPHEIGTDPQSPRKRKRSDDSESLLAELQPRAKQLLLSHDREECPVQLLQSIQCSKHSSDVPGQTPEVQPLKGAGDGVDPQYVPGDTQPTQPPSEELCTAAQSSPEAAPAKESAGAPREQALDNAALHAFGLGLATLRPEQASPAQPQVRAAAEETVQASTAAAGTSKPSPRQAAALSQGRTSSRDPQDATRRLPWRQPRDSQHMQQPDSAGRGSVQPAPAGRTTAADAPAWRACDWAETGAAGGTAAAGAPAEEHCGVDGVHWRMKEEAVPADWAPCAQFGVLRDAKRREQPGRRGSRERSVARSQQGATSEWAVQGGARQDNCKKPRNKKRPCSHCGKHGHSDMSCWFRPEPPANDQFCTYCNLYNHSDETCRYRPGHAEAPLLRCINCHKVGHKAQDCWQRPMHDHECHEYHDKGV